MAIFLSCLASVFFGAAIVTSKCGLRWLDPRSGAAISIPTSALLLIVASPFALDPSQMSAQAIAVFALAGSFFPVLVTILNFHSNDRLGPAITSTVLAGAVPLFSLAAAVLLLGETIPAHTFVATLGIVCGIVLVSWRSGRSARTWRIGQLAIPLFSGMLNGVARAVVVIGLFLWHDPFAATLTMYLVSSTMILALRHSRGEPARPGKKAMLWFAATGALNGAGMLTLNGALALAPLSLVAAFLGTYPLVTLALSVALLGEESISRRKVVGVMLAIASVAYLAVR